MLSFMREQGSGNPSDHSPAGTGAQGIPSAAGPDAQEFLTVATNRQNLRRSSVMLAILVAIGLVCLMFMIRKSQPQAASGKQSASDASKIEAAVGRLTGVRSEMIGRMDEIVQKFYEFSDVVQVKVGELVKDPFEVEGYTKGLQGQAVALADPQAQAEAVRRRKMQERAATLKLLSIMRSDSGNSCMVNDQILRQGETIEGFTVAQIGSNFVELTWSSGGANAQDASETEEMTTTLKLSD